MFQIILKNSKICDSRYLHIYTTSTYMHTERRKFENMGMSGKSDIFMPLKSPDIKEDCVTGGAGAGADPFAGMGGMGGMGGMPMFPGMAAGGGPSGMGGMGGANMDP